MTHIEKWKHNVRHKWEEIDPHSEELWGSLALGYFLGLGLSPEDAADSVREADEQGLI